MNQDNNQFNQNNLNNGIPNNQPLQNNSNLNNVYPTQSIDNNNIYQKSIDKSVDSVKYKDFLNDYIYNYSGDVLDQALAYIDNLINIKDKTKSLKLHYFDR